MLRLKLRINFSTKKFFQGFIRGATCDGNDERSGAFQSKPGTQGLQMRDNFEKQKRGHLWKISCKDKFY